TNQVLYAGGASGLVSPVTLNATATKMYLSQTSSGVPTFAQVALADLGYTTSGTGTVLLLQSTPAITTPTINTGGTLASGTLGVSSGATVNIASGASLTVQSGATFTSATTPTNATDVVNKQYVDTIAQGMTQKPTARVATAAALSPTNTYANGTAGVGATLTATGVGILTVDGVSTVLNDIILVKNEAAPANNGLYQVTTAGTAGVAYVLTRLPGMDSASEFSGAFIPVESEGTANKNSLWLCNNVTAPTVGTTAITFVQLNGATDLIQGTGLTISGNTISITNQITAGGPIGGAGAVAQITYNAQGQLTTVTSVPITLAGIGYTTTGSGTVLALATSPVFTTPSLGAATATSINGLTISTTTGTLTLVNGSTLATSGAFSTTLTASASVAHALPNEASKLVFLANATTPAANQVTYFDSTTGRVNGVAVNSGTIKYLSQTSSGVPTWSSPATNKFVQAVTGAGPSYGPYTHGLGSADINVTVVDDTGNVILPDIAVTSTTITLTYGVGAPTAVTHRLIAMG
ncbi:MAG: hypothetical protein JHC33_08780, partial [Ignisphaera sp.]|nr:hypothetical protein [Ignisphaera sp.]